jgi:hypothetical protein
MPAAIVHAIMMTDMARQNSAAFMAVPEKRNPRSAEASEGSTGLQVADPGALPN